MFGHHESAQATVLYAEDITSLHGDQRHSKIEFVLEVRPPTGQAFRAKTTHSFFVFTPYPQVGDVVNVTYDPKSLEVELDLHHDDRYDWKGLKHEQQVERQADQARRDALLAAPPGTPGSSTHSAGGAGTGSPDPALQELLRREEAERQAAPAGRQQWTGQGAQTPTGFPGTASPVNPHAQMSWEEAQALRGELKHSGVSGQAQILRKQHMGAPVHHHSPFFVEVLVQPDNMGAPFPCSFIAWVDANKEELKRGSTLPVTYDPQNPTRMVFLLPS